MRLPNEQGLWARRDATLEHLLSKRSMSAGAVDGVIIAAVILAIVLFSALILYFFLPGYRVKHPEPRYLPGDWLKTKWRNWTPSSEKSRYSTSLNNRQSTQVSRAGSPAVFLTPRPRAAASAANANRHSTASTVGRNNRGSVRSILTLPPYAPDARPEEQVIGREGERAGIDTVVEFPETGDEEEDRREEEMNSLFRIREARRVERSAREERRQARHDARARGDSATLERLRRERLDRDVTTAASQSTTLIGDHQSRGRERRISAVSYGDLGVARHDGSRVRADSVDSDQAALLDSAASMGGANRSRAGTGASSRSTLHSHWHSRSQSSLRFPAVAPDSNDDDSGSDFELVPTPSGHSRTGSDSPARETPRSGDAAADATVPFPSVQPPEYEASARERQALGEQAPPYSSPTAATSSTTFASLPQISVTSFTPIPEAGAARFDHGAGRSDAAV